jgi:hypothetical protein
MACTAYFALSFVSITYDECVPLWAMSSRQAGGLGYPQIKLGTLMTASGVLLTLYTIFLYPPISVRLGKLWGFKVGQASAAPFMLIIPCLSLLQPDSPLLFPSLVLIYTFGKMGCGLGFASLALLLNQCVPSSKRATLNGLSMTIGSISKAIGPFTGAIVFAWSIRSDTVGGDSSSSDKVIFRNDFPFNHYLSFIALSMMAISAAMLPLCEPMLSSEGKTDLIRAPGTTTTHKVSPSRPISGDEGLELGKYHPISLEADSSDEDVSVSDEDERVELV